MPQKLTWHFLEESYRFVHGFVRLGHIFLHFLSVDRSEGVVHPAFVPSKPLGYGDPEVSERLKFLDKLRQFIILTRQTHVYIIKLALVGAICIPYHNTYTKANIMYVYTQQCKTKHIKSTVARFWKLYLHFQNFWMSFMSALKIKILNITKLWNFLCFVFNHQYINIV